MPVPKRRHFFRSGIFRIEADFSLPPEICAACGWQPAQIIAGDYACPESGETYAVSFQVGFQSEAQTCLKKAG